MPRESPKALRARLEDVTLRLEEAEGALDAIRKGHVESVVVEGPAGPQIYSLEGASHSYRVLVEAMDEGAATLSQDGAILYCNARLAEMLGSPLARVIGSALGDWVPTSLAPQLTALLGEAKRGLGRAELCLRRTDGREIPVQASLKTFHDAGRALLCLVATDLSEQKRNEQVLAEGRLARSVLEQAAEAIVVCDDRGRITRASLFAEQLCGCTPLLASFDDVCHAVLSSRSRSGGLAAMALRGAVIRAEPATLALPDGREADLLVSANPLHGEDARVIGCVLTMVDVTEQKRAQQALRQSEELFRTIFQSAGVGIAQVDLFSSRLVRVNQRFTELTGYRESELEAMDYVELVHPAERTSGADDVARTRESELTGGYLTERRYLRKDGIAIDLQISGSVVPDAGSRPRHAILVAADLTEPKRVERELAAARISAENAKAAAEEASRAKDRFLAVLSHELRTPLTPVFTALPLVEREALSDQARHFLEVIRRNVELEARLIDDLLDLTRITRGKVELVKETVDLCAIIERAVGVCRPDIDARRLHFGIDWGPRPYMLHADAGRLQQVFWNLLRNAVKFTPKGGCVGIRCRPEGAVVVVEVNDSGIGLEPSALGSIFDAFAQAQRATAQRFGGLGLGLTISRSLAEMHGGRIEARSEGLGKGSTFLVRLPISSHGEAQTSRTVQSSVGMEQASQRTGLRVLVVEDHGDTAETMVSVLELSGYRVITAADVATALQALQEQDFDILISDLGLPDRSGLDLMRELRARGFTLPGIAVSGYGMDADLEHSRIAGFCAHLVKPVEPRRLLEVLEGVLRRSVAGE